MAWKLSTLSLTPITTATTTVVVLRMRHLQAPTAVVFALSTNLPTMLAFTNNVRFIASPSVMSRSSSISSNSGGSPFWKVSRHRIATTLSLQPLSSSTLAASADPTGAEEELRESVGRVRHLVDAAGRKTLAITGAGMSTDSGIPDYRGPQGSYSRGHKPMTHDEFLSSEENRKRYWARSTFGWSSFSKATPNAAHFALAGLEAAGKLGGVITQNVDGLHQKAGSRNVVDLHGRNDKVECMSCRRRSSRDEYQSGLSRLNAPWIAKHSPELATGESATRLQEEKEEAEEEHARGAGLKTGSFRLRADGDADVEPGAYLAEFVVPACVRCGGILKPSVVFFGDNVPGPRVKQTYRMVDESSVIIAAGSSLQVYSAFRLIKRAADAGARIVVVNLGETRAERSGLELLKVEAGVSSVLPLLL